MIRRIKKMLEDKVMKRVWRNKVHEAFDTHGYESIFSHVFLDTYRNKYPDDVKFLEEIKEKYGCVDGDRYR